MPISNPWCWLITTGQRTSDWELIRAADMVSTVHGRMQQADGAGLSAKSSLKHPANPRAGEKGGIQSPRGKDAGGKEQVDPWWNIFLCMLCAVVAEPEGLMADLRGHDSDSSITKAMRWSYRYSEGSKESIT
jgi:hypothetical protein